MTMKIGMTMKTKFQNHHALGILYLEAQE